ncbi:MAG: hypothetical protein EBZ59_07820 [Planctomycetia bacterium]|nr:hypothetical protein [Planctomycetia bacterium]
MMQTVPTETLDDNDLAATVLEYLERLRPHAGVILGVVAAALMAIAASILASSSAAAGRQQSSDALLSALGGNDIEAFNEVIRRYPGSPAAQWAQLVIADAALTESTDLLFSDREGALARLGAAGAAYAAILAGKPRGMVAERATIGLAKAKESLGQLEEARSGYAAVAAEYPSGGLASLASAHAAALGRESTRRWYDWFAGQKMSPPASPAALPAANGAGAAATEPPANKE